MSIDELDRIVSTDHRRKRAPVTGTKDSASTTPTASARERIIEAALSLIAERGLSAVTMTDIASAANVARQTLYNHFPDIDSAVAAVVERENEVGFQRLSDLLATVETPVGKLELLVRHVAASHARAHPLHGISSSLAPEVQAKLAEHDSAARSVISEILRDGVERRVFRPDLDPVRDAQLIQRLLEGVGELVAGDDEIALVAGVATRTILAAVGAQGAGGNA